MRNVRLDNHVCVTLCTIAKYCSFLNRFGILTLKNKRRQFLFSCPTANSVPLPAALRDNIMRNVYEIEPANGTMISSLRQQFYFHIKGWLYRQISDVTAETRKAIDVQELFFFWRQVGQIKNCTGHLCV